MNNTTKKILSYSLKAGIIILAASFSYHQLTNKHDLKAFQNIIMAMDRTKAIATMTVVFLFMLGNWVLEAAKWQYLAQKLSPMSLWESIQAVFCGLTWAIFTPNRLGEYGGRVMFLPQSRRMHGVFAMAVGSFGQNVVTNVVGVTAGMWFIWRFLHINTLFFSGLCCMSALFALMMSLFYFNIRWMVSLLNSVKFLRKYHRFFEIMGRYRLSQLSRVMSYCLARFAVFSFQYYLVIHLLVPEISMFVIFMMISIMFIIQSAIPSVDLLDMGVRSMTAATFFAYVTDQNIAIMAAVASIWFINLIIPAILGSVFVLKLKFFDNNL